ncbi:uncharacterized protein C8Q71DRAFT_905165 [Rhodofomes roseus]|uniref:Uncharacterized protein n=1 Tax=Rhodofomes roseus TaxID=34475 RepID=A0ABQ8KP60_9APHY|nr:uncharacterized protein C8Q71DRAFT_905165 [Rhodofomes roseus]KAH9839750.1 hypothetical protein C8Q71DRAFT_905165 [Rhodofomes roseus]
MFFAQPRSRTASVAPLFILLASAVQCMADSDDNSSASDSAVDFTVIVIAICAFLLILVIWCRWVMIRRRRTHTAPSIMAQSGPILPTLQPPLARNNARPLHSQESYLGENNANRTVVMRQEPPPAYHGKDLAEGEMVIPVETGLQPPSMDTETLPTYTTPTISALPPAYMPENDASPADNSAVHPRVTS